MVEIKVSIFIGKQLNLCVITISVERTKMKNAWRHFLLIKRHLATFLSWQKKTASLNFFFLSQVKGTLSFTSRTSERSSNTVTDQWNQLGYKQKTIVYELGKLCYFCQIFGSRESSKSRFSPTKSSRNPSSVRAGWYSILQAPWQSAQTETWWISGWCLCYESTSVAAEETATPLRWLVFPRDELLKMTHNHHHHHQRLNIFFSLTIIQESSSIRLSPKKMQETMKHEVCQQGQGTNLFTSGSYI